MKKLTLIHDDTPVTGYVIEKNDNLDFLLKRYFVNCYSTYSSETVYTLDSNQYDDVLGQDDLASRIKRIHHYFKEAEYISSSVIYSLNLDNLSNNDVNSVLSAIVYI